MNIFVNFNPFDSEISFGFQPKHTKQMRTFRTTDLLVASTSDNAQIQSLCAFNRRRTTPKKIGYIMSAWGKTKPISKAEYDELISKGFGNLVKQIELK